MENLYTWISFLAAPILLIAIVAWMFRPSARRKYKEAKRIPFADDNRKAGANR